jgi:hypothetical protein
MTTQDIVAKTNYTIDFSRLQGMWFHGCKSSSGFNFGFNKASPPVFVEGGEEDAIERCARTPRLCSVPQYVARWDELC